MGRKYPAVVSDSRESSFYTDGSLRMVTSPAFEPEVPVSVFQDDADKGSHIRRECGQVVLDRFVNCGDSRELLSDTCDFPGIAGGPNVTREVMIALAYASREELPTLMACLQQSVQQETPAELARNTSPVMPPDVEVLL